MLRKITLTIIFFALGLCAFANNELPVGGYREAQISITQ